MRDPDKADEPVPFGKIGGVLSLVVVGLGATGYSVVFVTAVLRLVRYEGFDALAALGFWIVWSIVGSAIGVFTVYAARLRGHPPHPLAKRGVVLGFWAAVVMFALGFTH